MARQAIESGWGVQRRRGAALVCVACVFGAAQAYAQVSVVTYHDDKVLRLSQVSVIENQRSALLLAAGVVHVGAERRLAVFRLDDVSACPSGARSCQVVLPSPTTTPTPSPVNADPGGAPSSDRMSAAAEAGGGCAIGAADRAGSTRVAGIWLLLLMQARRRLRVALRRGGLTMW
ncbi:MAG: hypothetical protein ACHQ4J_03910 [Candidatus Binatia bacterium]